MPRLARGGGATMPTQYSGAGLMVWWTWIAMRGLLPIEFLALPNFLLAAFYLLRALGIRVEIGFNTFM